MSTNISNLVRQAASPIQTLWQRAYLGEANPMLAERFSGRGPV
jgi:hypothetical protein